MIRYHRLSTLEWITMRISEIIKVKIPSLNSKKRNPVAAAIQQRGSSGAGAHEPKKYNRKEKHKTPIEELP